ncbi:MAG: MarR family winged helix-turn-helix transcriptional regulator [Dehalococcoidia bacterium]
MSTYSPEDLVALLRRFALERDRYVKLLARGFGMGRAEFDALDYIEEAGALTPNQLSDLLCLTSGATTALIDRLEAAGTVSRSPHPTDRRSVVLHLTTPSAQAGAARLSPYLQDIAAAAQALNEAERATVGAFLAAAEAAAAKHARIAAATPGKERSSALPNSGPAAVAPRLRRGRGQEAPAPAGKPPLHGSADGSIIPS